MSEFRDTSSRISGPPYTKYVPEKLTYDNVWPGPTSDSFANIQGRGRLAASTHNELDGLRYPSRLHRAWLSSLKFDTKSAVALARSLSTGAGCASHIERQFHVHLLWSFIALTEDNNSQALAYAEAAERHNSGSTSAHLVDTIRKLAYYGLGDLSAFHSVPRPSLCASGRRSERAIGMVVRALEAAAELQQLRLSTAERLISLAFIDGDRPLSGWLWSASLFTKVVAAEVDYERGNLAAVENSLKSVMPQIRAHAMLEVALRGYPLIARASVRLGNPEFALSALREGEEVAERRRWPRLAALCTSERMEIVSDLGYRSDAETLASRLVKLLDEISSGHPHWHGSAGAPVALAKIRLSSIVDPPGSTADLIQKHVNEAVAVGDMKFAIELSVRLVKSLVAAGEPKRASENLETVLAVAADFGIYQTILDGGSEIRALLDVGSSDEREPRAETYARLLLDAWPVTPFSDFKHRWSRAMDGILTTRERSVLHLISLGHSNKRVAQILGIAPETVKSHAKRIFSRLGASTRAEAVSRGTALGII